MSEIPPGLRRVYAIGDIHGRVDLLRKIVCGIKRDLEFLGQVNALTITLGDYVDRGPDSQAVLECLASNPFPTPYLPLKGNHEQLFETFMHNPTSAKHWRNLGGWATLSSYGVSVGDLQTVAELENAAESLRAKVPSKHLDFLASLKKSAVVGNYFFCHAGVRCGVPLDKQDETDLLWIRDEFLRSNEDFGKIIVHGHTPALEPEILSNRINLDTGAFMTGKLTCLAVELESGHHRFIST